MPDSAYVTAHPGKKKEEDKGVEERNKEGKSICLSKKIYFFGGTSVICETHHRLFH